MRSALRRKQIAILKKYDVLPRRYWPEDELGGHLFCHYEPERVSCLERKPS